MRHYLTKIRVEIVIQHKVYYYLIQDRKKETNGIYEYAGLATLRYDALSLRISDSTLIILTGAESGLERMNSVGKPDFISIQMGKLC